MDLQNKVALVTGAGVRLGQAIALKLGQLGMRVVIHYHQSEKGAKQTFKLLNGNESRHIIIQANLEDISSIQKLVENSEKKLGPISVLINNAADFFPTHFFSTNEEEWDHFFDLNLKAPFFLSQKVAKNMKIPYLETKLTKEDFCKADEAFLTNTRYEVLPITQVEGFLIGKGRPGPLTRKIRKGFLKVIEEETLSC